MNKIIKITALMMAAILMTFVLAACCNDKAVEDPKEEANAVIRETKKFTVTLTADEVPNYVAEKVVKGEKIYDSENDNDLGIVTDVLCEGSISYACDAGKFVLSEKMGYSSLIITTTVEASPEVEGWYIGDTLYGIGHTSPLHIGKAEVTLTIRSFEEIK